METFIFDWVSSMDASIITWLRSLPEPWLLLFVGVSVVVGMCAVRYMVTHEMR